MLNPMSFYTILQYDPRALESNTIHKARSYNSSQSAVYNSFYNVFANTMFPVLFSFVTIYTGEWV